MRSIQIIASIFFCLLGASVHAFSVQDSKIASRSTLKPTFTRVNMLGEDGPKPKKLTRENEPEEFFSSKMDEMPDEQKIPVALMGLAGISLPFILGMIALYAAK